MGVAGVGKTTVGRALARELGYSFVDADDFHSAENVEKMRRGEALDDRDREPWLRALRARLDRGDEVVLACSALKQAYRDVLSPAVFVWLDAPIEVVRARLRERQGHFVDEKLLESQVGELDVSNPSLTRGAASRGAALRVDATQPVSAIISDIRSRLP
jgi:gluconokinase